MKNIKGNLEGVPALRQETGGLKIL